MTRDLCSSRFSYFIMGRSILTISVMLRQYKRVVSYMDIICLLLVPCLKRWNLISSYRKKLIPLMVRSVAVWISLFLGVPFSFVPLRAQPPTLTQYWASFLMDALKTQPWFHRNAISIIKLHFDYVPLDWGACLVYLAGYPTKFKLRGKVAYSLLCGKLLPFQILMIPYEPNHGMGIIHTRRVSFSISRSKTGLYLNLAQLYCWLPR